MNKKINVACEKCKESFIFTSESSVVDKVLEEGHYICFTCEDKLELQNIKYREEIARMQKSLRKKNKSIKDLNESVKNIKSERDEWKVEANQLDKEKDEFIIENEKLKSQLQQQALPVVPECVANIVEYSESVHVITKLYVDNEIVDEIKQVIDRLSDEAGFSRRTNYLAWLKLNGYTVEKTQLFYLKHIDMSKVDETHDWFILHHGSLGHSPFCKGELPYYCNTAKFTQQEIDSMKIGSYEQIEVEK